MLGLQPMVSDHDAMDKTSMCEMPLIFMFEVLGLERAFFVLIFWVLAFCHWRFVPRSQPMACFGHRYPCYTLNTHYRSKVLSRVYFWKKKKVYSICNGSEEG